MNYYNEFDPFAAAWLIELIKAGLIPNGVVDDRSIVDIDPQDLTDFTQCHFFAGIGGWSRALFLANWPEERPVWTGSCPCQPFSVAGKQEGIHDERHLAPVWLDLIREGRPPVIFGEQVASAIEHGWFDTLQNDLENEKYTCAMVILPACSVKAPHLRQRLWFVAERVGFSNCAGPNAGRKRSSPPRHRYSFIATSSNGGLGFSNFPRSQGLAASRPQERGTVRRADAFSELAEPASWPSPRASDEDKSRRTLEGALKELQRKKTPEDLITAAWIAGPTRITASGQILTGCSARMKGGGRLNPEHSRWMMGYPVEWGNCADMVTLSFRKSPRK